MKMTPVTSSNIAAIGYDAETTELAVQFKNGKTFVYIEVSPDERAALMASESVGKHFNQFIKAVKVGREVVTSESDTTDMSDAQISGAPMSDKEKIKVLRDLLNKIKYEHCDTAELYNLIDDTLDSLEATKDGE